MKHEALEMLDRLHQEDNIPYVEYSRLYDLVECLIGDNEIIKKRNTFLLDKLNTIREIIK